MPLVWFYPPNGTVLVSSVNHFFQFLKCVIRRCTISVSLPDPRRTLRQLSLCLRDILPHNNLHTRYQYNNRNRNRTNVYRMTRYN